MRKSLRSPAVLLAAVAAVSASTMWVVARAQPADTTSPPPSNLPVAGPNMAAATAPTSAPTTQEAVSKASYYLGFGWGQSFKEQDFQVDMTSLQAGLADGIAGTPSRFTDQELQAAVMVVRTQMMEKERTKTTALSAKNKAEGEAFLAKNKTAEGVKTTASGLQYKITTEGAGPNPGPHDSVKVHYTGKLLDGKTFDSSIPRGEPVDIPLDSVVPGWAEGLQLMKVGSKGTLWIPGNLGFGDTAAGEIPPGSTLVFDIELIGINPPSTEPAMGGMGAMPTTLPDVNGMPEPMPTPTQAPAPAPGR